MILLTIGYSGEYNYFASIFGCARSPCANLKKGGESIMKRRMFCSFHNVAT